MARKYHHTRQPRFFLMHSTVPLRVRTSRSFMFGIHAPLASFSSSPPSLSKAKLHTQAQTQAVE